jgi:hypothetical protein
MDKKVLIFFSIFAIVMIGGSFTLSLWIFPKIVSNSRYIGFGNSGMIEPSPGIVFTREALILIITQMVVTIVVVLLVGRQLIKRINQDRPDTVQGYLFKMSRITGKSEFEIFHIAAEDWPVSDNQIELDFNTYMALDNTPYYVNHFVRKNQQHIDKLHLQLFIFKQH